MNSKKLPENQAKLSSSSNDNLIRPLFLIDASSFIFRAYYALAPLSSKGRPSQAVVGFANTLLKLLREKKPLGCVVVFDSKKPTFRKEIYPKYKANRVSPPPDLSGQIEAVREMCQSAGLPILQQEGFEADDWIATFVKRFDSGRKIVIVSTDKDLMQLVTEKVHLYDAFKSKEIGPSEVQEKWGISPEQMADYLSLAGDSSDNIPGIPGVGPKTAASLLGQYGSIEGILKKRNVLPEKLRKKFEEHLSDLEVSQKLVALKVDLNLPFEEVPEIKFPFPDELRRFLHDWDCVRTLEQFSEELGSAQVSGLSTSSRSESSLHLAKSLTDLERIAGEVKKVGVLAFDVETNSFDRFSSQAVGVSVAWNGKEAWYLPWRHSGSELDPKHVHAFLSQILKEPHLRKVAHNLKFDVEILRREGILFEPPLDDTMILGYLLYADRRSFSLENLGHEFLGEEKGDLKALLNGGMDFSKISLDKAYLYAAQDAHLAFGLYEKFFEKLQSDVELRWLYENIEIPLIEVIAAMEGAGIYLNTKYLQGLSKQFHQEMDEIQKDIFRSAGGEFNINSPKQLQEILFGRLKLLPTKKTKTGFSTDESVLEDLSDKHELPKLLLRYRKLSKLTSTYVDVLPALISKKDHRIHTHYHQTGTSTGRLSSSEPNLQNIPIRTEEGARIRAAFEAPEGYLLLSADYSQVELRLFAHMAGDENLIRAFLAERDIHAETAKIIFGSGESEYRERAKAINYGIIYGISAFGLSKQLGISRVEAAEFMEAYFRSFPGLKTHMQELVERTRAVGYSVTLFGRRRPLPDINSKNPTLRQMAERMAINAPVQGTAADIMKFAMVRIFRRLKGDGAKARLLLQVHDELVLEVPVEEVEDVRAAVKSEMENLARTPLHDIRIPLVVDTTVGRTWGSMG
jgi:DNA polymerase-1